MALHEIPEDGAQHDRTGTCACRPARSEGIHRILTGPARGLYQGVKYTHRRLPLPASVADPFPAGDSYDETFGGAQ